MSDPIRVKQLENRGISPRKTFEPSPVLMDEPNKVLSPSDLVKNVFHNMGGQVRYLAWADRNEDKFYDLIGKMALSEEKSGQGGPSGATIEINMNFGTDDGFGSSTPHATVDGFTGEVIPPDTHQDE